MSNAIIKHKGVTYESTGFFGTDLKTKAHCIEFLSGNGGERAWLNTETNKFEID